LQELYGGQVNLRIKVDFRESDKTIRTLEQLIGKQVAVTRLEIGDIATDKVLIEHKTVSDLVSSLIDGRLYYQAARLAKDPRATWMLVDGTMEECERMIKKPINWKMVIGALTSISVRYGISIIWLENLRPLMYIAWKICEKVEEGKLGLPKFKRYVRKPTYIHPKVWLLMRALNLPYPVAKNLLETFKSPKAVFNATEEQLRRVSGIGKIRAKKIAQLVS